MVDAQHKKQLSRGGDNMTVWFCFSKVMCRVQGVGELGISLVVVILYLWGIISGVLAIHHTLRYFGGTDFNHFNMLSIE